MNINNQNEHYAGRYPTKRVTAVLKTFDDVQAMVNQFHNLGYSESEIAIASGEEGIKRLDPTGKHHGFLRRVTRLVQNLGDTQRDLEQYQEALEAGQFVVAVATRETFDKEQVADVIRAHQGHNLHYYGHWLIEELSDKPKSKG